MRIYRSRWLGNQAMAFTEKGVPTGVEIENRNGVIRRFPSKKTDFNSVTIEKVQQVENEINNRPIRKFKYISANEVFSQLNGSSVALLT